MKKTIIILLILCLIFVVGSAGCGLKQQSPDVISESEETAEEVPAETVTTEEEEPEPVFGEAPMLAEMVEAGELPSVEERLPVNPVIIQPVDEAGIYGGTWRMGTKADSDKKYIRLNAGYENLVRWNPEWNRIIPNVAQSYEINEDASEFTFYLREGMRWSDGEPFTADDIVFWYEADILNEELRKTIPNYFVVDGVPVIVEKIDTYIVKFSFAAPYGQFLYELADVRTDEIAARPMHYLKQFHPDYNPEGVDAMIAEAGVEDWVELWKLHVSYRTNPDVPTLNAWVLADRQDENSSSILMERNPYYWKVDTDFNQLPYIDNIEFVIYPTTDDMRQAAKDGQIDMQYIALSIKESNYDEWAENMAAGEYNFHTLINPRSNYLSIQLNLVHQDPVLREIFSNKTFRIALSHALDRSEIVDQVFGIPFEIRQPSPLNESPYYREGLAKQYTEFNLPYANELLDQAGFDRQDTEGYRLTSEGQRIEFTISIVDDQVYLSAAEMVSEYWRELGILVHIEQPEGLQGIIKANEHDAVIVSIVGGLDVVQQPGIYIPHNVYHSYWAIPWVYWYEDNSLGEEPPESVKEQLDLFNKIKGSTDIEEIEGLMNQILAIAEEEFYVMGICENQDFYALVKTNFHNVPLVMPKSFAYPTPAPTNPCQYFIDPQT